MAAPTPPDARPDGAADAPAPTPAANPRADGRTRCTWVAGRPEHHAFHDAEWGMVPDDDALVTERLFLTCLQKGRTLVEALDVRDRAWTALQGCDAAKVAALDDAALARIAAEGGALGDRARLAMVRDVAAAAAETGKQTKGLREYVLALRFLDPAAQIEDLTARFPGFDRLDAAHFMENLGLVPGAAHERDCWRA